MAKKCLQCKHILEEFIRNVLICLPVKALCKFKCVCKAWCTMINDSFFVMEKVQHDYKNTLLLFIKKEKFRSSVNSTVFILDITKQSLQSVATPEFMHHSLCNELVGSSDGLILVKSRLPTCEIVINLWNPAIRKSRKISGIRKQVYSYGALISFCFNPLANEHQIILIYKKYKRSKTWWFTIYDILKESSDEYEVDYLQCDLVQQPYVYLNGFIYWLAYRLVDGKYTAKWVLIFDIEGLVFKEVSIPEVNEDWYIMILEYNDKIGIARYEQFNKDDTVFEFWLLEDDDNPYGTWTRIANIYQLMDIERPLFIWSNSILCSRPGKDAWDNGIDSSECNLFTITLDGGSKKDVAVHLSDNSFEFSNVIKYNESLLEP